MTLLATATNVPIAAFPTSAVLAQAPQPSEMCAYCHALGKCVPGRQTQTYLEWRDDFYAAGLGKQQCQDCHMPRTLRKTAEDADVLVRAVARHLWTGGHSGQRPFDSTYASVASKGDVDIELGPVGYLAVGSDHRVVVPDLVLNWVSPSASSSCCKHAGSCASLETGVEARPARRAFRS